MNNYMQKIITQHISQKSILLMALLRAGRLQQASRVLLSSFFLFGSGLKDIQILD